MHAFTFLSAVAIVAFNAGCGSGDTIKAETTSTSTSSSTGSQGAGGSTGSGNGCCSEPVKIGGQVKVITASEDPDQTVVASVTPDTASPLKVADGPFVLTDMFVIQNEGTLSVSPTTTCSSAQRVIIATVGGMAPIQLHGLHLAVPKGSTLCTEPEAANPISYAGYRPY